MHDTSHPARRTRHHDRSSLGLTPVPVDRQMPPEQARPHHPLVTNRRAALSGALREEIQELRHRSHGAEVAKSAILANISHEFRTPLNAIIGFSELMLSEATGKIENERHCEYLDGIHKSAFRLLNMVNALLDTADMTSGLATMDRQEADIVALFAEAHEASLGVARARRINLELEADGPACFMTFDAKRLLQAARDILAEAIRRAPPGGTILVRIESRPDTVTINVRCLSHPKSIAANSGEPSDPYFVRHVSDDSAHSDVDLGLSIAKTVVELHGGVFETGKDDRDELSAKIVLPRQ